MPNTPVSHKMPPALLILTHPPYHPLTAEGLTFARHYCQDWQSQSDDPVPLTIFCYGDGAMIANRLIWQPADIPNVAKDWQKLVKDLNILAQVCVSTALARGVTDSDNAKRHNLTGENLADGFSLVGLGELAMHLHQHTFIQQF